MKRKSIGTLRTKSMFFIIFAVFCGLWFQPFMTNAKSAETIDRIVAVVNDDVITLNELNKVLQPYIHQIRSLGYLPEKEKQMIFKVRQSVLDRLIDEKIEDQEIKREKIEISDHQIDEAIERIKETHYYTDEDLRAALASQAMTMKEYRKQIKDQIARAKLVNLNVKSKIVITKEDIKAYYEKHLDQYGGKEKYHLRNIIMRVPEPADSASRLEIKEKMEGILKKLNAGQPFEALAKQYSQSPAAADGGDLGLFEFDSLSPKLQEAIKNIKPGGFTPVLDTDQGFQIFYLQKIVKTVGKPLKAVSSEIEDLLYNKITEEKYGEWIQSIRKKAVIRIIQ